MAITFGSNIASLLAQSQLNRVTAAESSSFERLSSGMRINRASDDAAGLSVASQLNAKSRIYTQAIRNANDGISALSIAESAVSSASDILQRLRELAVGASNGSFSRTQRISSDQEARTLTEEYNRIFGSVDFNGLKLLNGQLGQLRLQVGEGLSGSIGFGLGTELDRTAGNGSFTTTQFVNGIVASQIEGDFNGDGRTDLVTNTGGTVALRLGKVDGTFTNNVIGAAGASSVLVSGDFNGDGLQDFAFSSSPTAITVYKNQGNGSFSGTSIGTVSNISSYSTGDINNDGRSDLIVTSTSGGISAYLAAVDGTFSTVASSFSGSTSGIVTGDLNGDGNVDLLNGINTFLGRGDGTFSSAIASGTAGSVFLNDFNRDGILDSLRNLGTGVVISLGQGDGTFATGQTYSFGGNVFGSKLGDLNGDGITDILANANGTMKVMYGAVNGSFSDPVSLGFGPSFGGQISFGDFNGDGAVDYVASGGSSSNVYVAIAGTTQVTTLQQINLTTRTDALNSIALIDSALQRSSAELGAIGSIQSRLSSALSTLASTKENYDAASSRITDVDIASETAELVRSRTLKEVSAAILAQANQAPSLTLQLLKIDKQE